MQAKWTCSQVDLLKMIVRAPLECMYGTICRTHYLLNIIFLCEVAPFVILNRH
jgi:hypothetical protein